MKGIVTVEAEVDPQDVYDDLTIYEQKKFLLDNISDLKDEDLIQELTDRGYNMEDIQK